MKLHTIVLSALLLAFSCAAAKPLISDVSCSPKADLWYQVQLKKVCGPAVQTHECPEAEMLGDEYERREQSECSAQ